MAARMLFGLVAVVSAFACSGCVFAAAFRAARRRTAALGTGAGPRAVALWYLRNGVGPALPLARQILRIGPVRALCDEASGYLSEAGHATTAESLASLAIAGEAALALLAGVALRSPVGVVAVPVCAGAAVAIRLASERDRRADQLRAAVPDALDSMSACFGSGFTLLQTFNQVAADVGGPLGAVFARSAHILQTGGSIDQALRQLQTGAHASELAFVAVALDVQHQSGGAMRQVIDAAAETVKGELELRRALRVQTAQAKLSARVVAVMPFVLVAAFSIASPNFLLPFFSGVYGYALLGLALLMLAGGVAMVRRALSVEGVA